MGKVQTIVVVAAAYLALGAFAAYFAYSDQDAWGVWPASGFALGLLFVRPRSNWAPVLAGAFVGALIFEPLVGSSLPDALGYAVIEVLVTFAGGAVAAQLSPPPTSFRVAARCGRRRRGGSRARPDGGGDHQPMGRPRGKL